MTVKRQFQDQHALEQMQWYQATLGNQWDLVWKPDVNLDTELPTAWSEIWDTRLVRSTWEVYRYTENWWAKLTSIWEGSWVDSTVTESSSNPVMSSAVYSFTNTQISSNNSELASAGKTLPTNGTEWQILKKWENSPEWTDDTSVHPESDSPVAISKIWCGDTAHDPETHSTWVLYAITED